MPGSFTEDLHSRPAKKCKICTILRPKQSSESRRLKGISLCFKIHVTVTGAADVSFAAWFVLGAALFFPAACCVIRIDDGRVRDLLRHDRKGFLLSVRDEINSWLPGSEQLGWVQTHLRSYDFDVPVSVLDLAMALSRECRKLAPEDLLELFVLHTTQAALVRFEPTIWLGEALPDWIESSPDPFLMARYRLPNGKYEEYYLAVWDEAVYRKEFVERV